jgi:N utilization substance protein A
VAEVALCFELGRATVVVNDDQLSLAIGKRGQNVRLAARLTGWDIDILTPPEFQKGVQRLDQTLKSIEGIAQEHVDKVIALGLIDVRDIEEVGIAPLMEELGLDEEMAQRVVDRCAEEAKVVAIEQEEQKKAEAAAKEADRAALLAAGAKGVDGVAFANPLLPQTPDTVVTSEDSATEDDDGRMPGTFEATAGAAPEITTHSAEQLPGDAELSPEEQAIQLPGNDQADDENQEPTDDDDDTAALAEGRAEPPAPSGNEPA